MKGFNFRPLIALFIGVAALGACKKKGDAESPDSLADVPPGEMGSACTQRSDCTGGLACTAGVCSSCTEDFDCAPYACNEDTGRCDPMGSCQVDADCAQGEICDATMCVYAGGEGAGVCGLDSIYFAFDSATITPTNETKLDSAAECLAESGTTIYLEAHADNVGTEEYNIMLTDRRGRTVLDYLSDHGVAESQLQVVAKGALEATGSTEPERAQDRRVDFIPE